MELLKGIQSCLGGVGSISIRKTKDSVDYTVGSVGDLVNVVIPFFKKYSLITRKHGDFILFSKIVELINKKEHYTLEGIQKIVNFKASLNKGLSNELKEAFPNTKPALRPVVDSHTIHPSWLAGFIYAEGCFFIGIRNSSDYKLGSQVTLVFQISQHLLDAELMKSLVEYLKTGRLIFRQNHPLVVYEITKYYDIEEIIIPFL